MSKRKSTVDFIKEAKEVHGDKYDYSMVEYINAHTKVCIICSKHGKFWQTPHDHLKGCGCNKCKAKNVGDRRRISKEDFIRRAVGIHGKKYDYSNVNYTSMHEKVCILCQKHGEFWMRPYAHLQGQGCKRCKISKLEKDIYSLLEENNISFRYDVRDLDFLSGLTLDFYIPEYKIGIECQGIQHFEDSRMFKCADVIKRDNIKRELCKNNGIKLLYYSNLEIDYPYPVLTDKNNLINKIKEYAE